MDDPRLTTPRRPHRRLAASILLVLSACGSAPSPAGPQPPPPPPRSAAPMPDAMHAELDARIGAAFQRVGLAPGLAVAAFTRDGVYARGFGVTDVDTRAPVTADTAFYIASSTKSFTALAMAILAGRGELDLDATLAQLAPDAPFPAQARADAVRVRDLLAHTHGIENDPIAFRVAFTGLHDPATLWRLLGASIVNAKAPLGTFEYTNTGYNILTILTDRRLGVRWQDLLQREIFGPAGMAHTTAIASRAAAERWSVARPHVALDGTLRRLYLEKVDQTMQSAGGLYSTARDAARWLELMLDDGKLAGRQILPAAAVRAVLVPQTPAGAPRDGKPQEHYGLGWSIGRHRDDVLVHHHGGFVGARAHISFIPARGVGVAAFVNSFGAPSDIIDAVASYIYDRAAGRADADAVFDAAIEAIATRQAAEVTRYTAGRAERTGRPWTLTQPRSAYAGSYDNDRYGTIEIASDGDALRVQYGVLRAVAEPFTKPDAIRVELTPPRGQTIEFDLAGGTAPVALVYDDQLYVHRAATR